MLMIVSASMRARVLDASWVLASSSYTQRISKFEIEHERYAGRKKYVCRYIFLSLTNLDVLVKHFNALLISALHLRLLSTLITLLG